MEWEPAFDIQKEVKRIIARLKLAHLNSQRIFCFRSYGSKSKARARIWSLPKIWQKALKVYPAYCLEIISEKFDKLGNAQQQKILLHELLHIPKNFSGSLLPHRKIGRERFEKRVEKLFKLMGDNDD